MVDKFFFSPLASPLATWILNGVSRNASRDPSILEETSRYVRSADFLIGEKKKKGGIESGSLDPNTLFQSIDRRGGWERRRKKEIESFVERVTRCFIVYYKIFISRE